MKTKNTAHYTSLKYAPLVYVPPYAPHKFLAPELKMYGHY